jgi:hypothetical protein
MTQREQVLADIDQMFGDKLPKHAQETLADFCHIDGDDFVMANGGAVIVGLYDENNPIATAYWTGVITALEEEDPYA